MSSVIGSVTGYSIYLEGVISGLISDSDDLRRRLAHQQGVIEALQANIADLMKTPPEVSLTPLVGDRRAVLTIGLYESKPAIPAQALKVAKLPKFF